MLGALFNLITPKRSEAEKALKSWGIKYEKKPDGSILVRFGLDISNKGLTKLPDLSSVTVIGPFSCNDNQLTSLKGAPRSVSSSFFCFNNQLTSLAGAPQEVGGGFHCNNNPLTSLEHAPRKCTQLTSDLGDFASWQVAAGELNISPEIKSRLAEEEQAKAQTAIYNAIVLQNNLPVKGPVKLKKRTRVPLTS